MPKSRSRKPHHQPQPHPPTARRDSKNHNAIIVGIIFFGLLGMGIGWFAAGNDGRILALGAILGGIGGFFFGKQIEKTFAKK